MTLYLLAGLGGALGSMARHGLNHVIHQRNLASSFPLGTLLINVAGSVVIGLVAGGLASSRWSLSLESRTFIVVGLLGGFTTFSSFSLDTLVLLRQGNMTAVAANVVGQVTLSLAGVWLGYRIAA